MAEIIWFLQEGWKLSWKQRLVWLFSAFSFATPLFRLFQIKYTSASSLNLALLYLAGDIFIIFLTILNFIGVPYLVYCFAISKPATFSDAFSAAGKFFGRVFGCSLLGLLVLSPFLCLVFALSFDSSTKPPHFSNNISLLFLPLALFAALPDFARFEFFENDLGIRQTLSTTWKLFTLHFNVLAALGIILMIVFRIFSAVSVILTVLIHSGFDVTPLSKLNYLNPSLSFRSDLLLVLINGIVQMIYLVFSTSVFALAYLKYREEKKPSLIKRAKH